MFKFIKSMFKKDHKEATSVPSERDVLAAGWRDRFGNLLNNYGIPYRFSNETTAELYDVNNRLCARVFYDGTSWDGQSVVGLIPRYDDDAEMFTWKGWYRGNHSISWRFVPMKEIALAVYDAQRFIPLYELGVN